MPQPKRLAKRTMAQAEGSALLEFAITLPLLVVFVVGIFDFSGAFNQKQKIEQAAQQGAIIAAAQPTSDIDPSNPSPASLQPAVTIVYNSLKNAGVLPQAGVGSCIPSAATVINAGLTWTYSISGCSPDVSDNLIISIDRGWVPSGATGTASVCTKVTVNYNYHWRFNSAIQLLFPGAGYAAVTNVTETSTVHNQT